MFMPILPRPTNPISIRHFPNCDDDTALRLGYSNLPVVQRPRAAARLLGFYVVFEHQITQVLALEYRRHRSRQRDRQHLARLVVDARFVLGTEPERPHRRVVVSIARAPGPERHPERWLVNRNVQHEIRRRPPDRTVLRARPGSLLRPASANLACEHVLGGVLDARLVVGLLRRRRDHSRLIGRAANSSLHDWPE